MNNAAKKTAKKKPTAMSDAEFVYELRRVLQRSIIKRAHAVADPNSDDSTGESKMLMDAFMVYSKLFPAEK